MCGTCTGSRAGGGSYLMMVGVCGAVAAYTLMYALYTHTHTQ